MISEPLHSGVLSAEQTDLLKILAHTYLQHNLPEKAAILLHAIYLVEPEDLLVKKSLACAYVRSGKPFEAMLLLDFLEEEERGTPEVHLLRSQAYLQMGQVADAAEAMGRFVKVRSTPGSGENR